MHFFECHITHTDISSGLSDEVILDVLTAGYECVKFMVLLAVTHSKIFANVVSNYTRMLSELPH